MKNIFSILTTLLLLPFYIFIANSVTLAQISFVRTFGGIYEDVGSEVKQTSDGGYIIVGRTSFGTGGFDGFLIKTDAAGDTLWTKTYGYVPCGSVQQTTDGEYIITGTTCPYGTNQCDAYLIKTDDAGDTIWTRIYGGTSYDYGNSVQQTTDGGYIVAGTTWSFGAGLADVYLIRTNSSGDTLWSRTYGGINEEWGAEVQQTTDSGFIIIGTTLSFGAGMEDIYLIKTNTSGDTVWTRTFGGTDYDVSSSVQQTNDGGYIIVGTTGGTFIGGQKHILLINTNSNGDTVWTRTYNNTNNDYGNSVRQTSDGGYIVIGSSAGDVYLIKTDFSGDTLWTRILQGPGDYSSGFSIQQTSDAGYIIAGMSISLNVAPDVLLIKTEPDGTVDVQIHGVDVVPTQFELKQNYPNPFNPTTTIRWQSPIGSWQTLKIYDLLGREVATLVDEYKPAGSYEVEFDASDLSSGVYFYRLQAGEFADTKKLILMK